MQITPSQATAQTTTSPNTGTALNSDYETFLKMLTVQMNNQDPLNPVDSSDYAVQLATFSSVEQQVVTNDLLAAMQAQLGMMNLSQLAGWVGMEGQAMAPGYFDGSPIEVATYPDPLADQVEMIVLDESGREVLRRQIEPGQQALQWDGTDNGGNQLPHGLYSIRTDSYANGAFLGQHQADVYSRIIEARAGQNGIVLVLEGGTTIEAGAISALREAGQDLS